MNQGTGGPRAEYRIFLSYKVYKHKKPKRRIMITYTIPIICSQCNNYLFMKLIGHFFTQITLEEKNKAVCKPSRTASMMLLNYYTS